MENILLLGSRSAFSATVLSHLVQAGIARLHAGVLKESDSPFSNGHPVAHSLSIAIPDAVVHMAEATNTPLTVFDALDDIDGFEPRPDLIVTACFPRRLPRVLLDRPRAGGLNVHPSLLPAYRGPSPIFWQLRAGETTGGVTVHKLNEDLDAGDIVAATSIPLAAGMTAGEINGALIDAGGRLLVETLKGNPWDALPCRPQDESKASYHSWPAGDDFHISRRWSAERAFRFMRGSAEWNHPWVLDIEDTRLLLDRAIDFDNSDTLPSDWQREEGGRVRIAFDPGVLRASLRDVSSTPRR